MEPDNEQSNKHAKIFLNLLKEAEKELYLGCTEATKVSFIVQLFQIKCMYGINNAALEAILNMFSIVLPKGHCIPDTMDKVQRVI
jgi:fibrillarin-like rRNA methylase